MNTYDQQRKHMVEYQLAARGISDPLVLEAMAEIKRHEFVDEASRAFAYDDRPLSIGFGQTISQPFIVARMTELLDVMPEHRVLEVGGGCGYQTAILCRLARHAYVVEYHKELAERARENLKRAGLDNFTIQVANGSKGWPEHAPFDRILAGCAPATIPEALLHQLAYGGKLVIPVGPRGLQELTMATKELDGSITYMRFGQVAFVPLLSSEPGA